MRQAIHRLVEAARNLKLSVVDRNGRHLVIGVQRDEMQERLLELHDALEQVDQDGATDVVDARRMREALDATFRWIKTQGLSIEEPVDIVAKVLGVEGTTKKDAGYEIMPSFAPQHERKRKGWKPVLALPGERLTTMRTISDHQKQAGKMDQVVDRMGAVAPGFSRP